MAARPRRVVTIRFTVDAGDALAAPDAARTVTYLEGTGRVVPGLERALADSAAGNRAVITVAPADGYGVHDPARVRRLPRGKVPDKVAAGTRCRVQADEGYVPALIVALDADGATVDLNHPQAGKTLRFDVQVLDARDATADELAHGHAHGPGGAH